MSPALPPDDDELQQMPTKHYVPELRTLPSLVKSFFVATYERYRKASLFVKIIVWIFILVNTTIIALLIVVGPKAMAQAVYDLSQSLKRLPYGWLILVSVIAITSFPPLIGWSTSISVCGFAYGLQGWYVAAVGALAGAAVSFVVMRLLFRNKLKAWTQKKPKWQALETVIRARGLPLIILIRLSPFPPWVYNNLLFASIETVSFVQFMVATVFYTPKLLIAVWIGSRVAMLSDGSQRKEMDTKTEIVNILSIVVGIALAVGTGWLVWRLTEKEIRNTPGVSEEDDRMAAEALEHAADDLEAPLIRSLSPQRYRDEEAAQSLDGVSPRRSG